MVGVPMHFLTKVGDEDSPQELFVDCFNRRTLLRSECIDMIRSGRLYAWLATLTHRLCAFTSCIR